MPSPTARAPRWLLVLLPVLALVTAAQVGGQLKPVAVQMTESAQKFINTLTEEEKKVTLFPFDSSERTAWYFVPLQDKEKKPTRKGLRLEVMKEHQQAAAMELVQSALSEVGFSKVKTIMSLESVLHEQEQGRGNVRNPGWYFVTIFGSPSLQGSWGWRVEGHHLSLNFTMKDGKVASITPAFFGSNPGEIKSGPRQGTRPLASTLDRALFLMSRLSEDQRKIAQQSKAFPEVVGASTAAKVGKPLGLRYPDLQPEQQKAIRHLVEGYLENFHPELQKQEQERIGGAGWEELTFAYSGTTEPGTPVTYRLHGPNVLVEFLNVQADGTGNKNNHYHTSWRTLPMDFGIKPVQ